MPEPRDPVVSPFAPGPLTARVAVPRELAGFAAALAGRYAIQRELGRGGIAAVYLARDVKHERLVALKVLDPDLGQALGAARFLAEIGVTAGLQHPNLVPIFDSGEAAGRLFYAMPYVDGESLRDRLRRERQLPLEDALRIAREVADALAYAHNRGILHRDVKPENVCSPGTRRAPARPAGGTRWWRTSGSRGR